MNYSYAGIGHIALLCNHYEETLNFYTNHLKLPKMFDLHREDGSLWLTYIKIKTGQFLELFPRLYPGLNHMENRSQNHFCLQMDDLCKTEFIVDPEGNHIEIKQIAESGAQKSIPYCSFKCNQYEKTIAFYRDTLGMKEEVADSDAGESLTKINITDKEYIELVDQKYPENERISDYSFMHICLLVDDIAACARELEHKGMTLWRGPQYSSTPYTQPYEGKTPGRCGSFAFYIQDPEGNEIEVMQYTKDSLQLSK